jgi:glyoxylase-like metal-dependent hydrolase (beta-lactamase superfamily II)
LQNASQCYDLEEERIMKKIIDGIYWIEGLLTGRVYILVGTDGLTLIDTSLPNAKSRIEKDLATQGYKLADIKRILITHAHPDHIGSVGAVQKATGAPVYAHHLDAPVILGEQPIILPPPEAVERPISRMINRVMVLPKIEPAPVDCLLNEGDTLNEVWPGMQVVHFPGHSIGQVGFWLPDKRLMFCGDTVMRLLFGRLSLPFDFVSPDWKDVKRSARKLADMNVDILCMGHGAPYIGGADSVVRELVRKLKL